MNYKEIIIDSDNIMLIDERQAENFQSAVEGITAIANLLGYKIKKFTFPVGNINNGMIVLEFKINDEPYFWLEFLLDKNRVVTKSSLLFYDEINIPIRSYNILEPIYKLASLL